MFSYETGLGISFLLWLWGGINIIISTNSLLQRNLNKVGMRLSWLNLEPKPMDSEYLNRPWYMRGFKFILIAAFGVLSVLLSWLHVAFFIGVLIYKRSKDMGAPKAVQELRWKLRNVDMTFDQIVQEMIKASGDESVDFNTYRNEWKQSMEQRGLA